MSSQHQRRLFVLHLQVSSLCTPSLSVLRPLVKFNDVSPFLFEVQKSNFSVIIIKGLGGLKIRSTAHHSISCFFSPRAMK